MSSVLCLWLRCHRRSSQCLTLGPLLCEKFSLVATRRALRLWQLECVRSLTANVAALRAETCSGIPDSSAQTWAVKEEQAAIIEETSTLAEDLKGQRAIVANLRLDLTVASGSESNAKDAMEMAAAGAQEALGTMLVQALKESSYDQFQQQLAEIRDLEVTIRDAIDEASVRLAQRLEDAAAANDTSKIFQDQLRFVTAQYTSALAVLDAEMTPLATEKMLLEAQSQSLLRDLAAPLVTEKLVLEAQSQALIRELAEVRNRLEDEQDAETQRSDVGALRRERDLGFDEVQISTAANRKGTEFTKAADLDDEAPEVHHELSMEDASQKMCNAVTDTPHSST